MDSILGSHETKPKSRLGRGLSSLMAAAELPVQGSVAAPPLPDKPSMLPVHQISVNPNQPRRVFDETELAALADSIRANGVIQPIIVRQTPGGYQLIAGERRLRAAAMVGLIDIPVRLTAANDWTQSQWALIENIHRADLNPVERAEAYRNLMRLGSLTQAELATKLGEDRSTIANHLRLLDLDQKVLELLQGGQLTLGHAKVLAAEASKPLQVELAQRVVSENWSVRTLEAARGEANTKNGKTKPKNEASAHVLDLEKSLARQLGLKVQLRASANGKGRLIIRYGSLEQFDELLSRLGVQLDD